MKIAAGVLCHQLYKYDRMELFKQTVRSIAVNQPDDLFLVSNGSDDGTEHYIAGLGGTVVYDPITSCGHGMNVTIGICAASGADIVVFSNDDIIWHPGAFDVLRRFWAHAPDDLLIASGHLEEDFPWNTVLDRIEVAGIPTLVRRTAPGGTWTLRAKDWPKIAPVPESPGYDDVPVCERLGAKGYRVAQLDLATHIGEEKSTWGNGSAKFGKPLDADLRASLQQAPP